ncbi:MAG: hypothetical protein ACYTDT_14145, partial [Planctomycetota bacterium]
MTRFQHDYFRIAAKSEFSDTCTFLAADAEALSSVLELRQAAIVWEKVDTHEATEKLASIYSVIITQSRARLDHDTEFEFLRRRKSLQVSDVEDRTRWLCEFATRADRLGYSEDALAAIDEALEACNACPSLCADVLINKGLLLGYAGEFDESMECLNRAVDYSDSLGDSVIAARANMNMSIICRRNRLMDEALEFAQNAEGAYRNKGNLS